MSQQAKKSKLITVEELFSLLEQGCSIRDILGGSEEASEAFYTVAYKLYSAGRYEDAEATFAFLCAYNHLEKKYFMGLAATRQMQKKYEEAITAYAHATLLDPNDPEPPYYAGLCHVALKNWELAASGLEGAIHFAVRPRHRDLATKAKAKLSLVKTRLAVTKKEVNA